MQSNTIQLTGVLSGTPANCSYFSASLQDLLPLNFCDVYAALKNNVLSNINGSSVSPVPIPLEGITAVRVLAIRVLAGVTVNLIMTNGKGTAIVPVSDVFLLRARNPGDEVTAIAIDTSSQDVDVAYLVAGDVT